MRWSPIPPSRGGPDERGLVAVWTALLLVVLLAIAGFAVDYGNWYVHANKLQKAADAAALAGVTHLPSDTAGAISVAQANAQQNGYVPGGANNVQVTACPGGTVTPGCSSNQTPTGQTRLQVSLSETVPSLFANLVGYRSQGVTRTAVAEYEQPVAMGSPSNTFGNEPIGPLDGSPWSNDPTHSPNLWANVKGPQSTKATGDATQAYLCGGLGAPQNCANNVQADYNKDGYFYRVQVNRTSHPGQHLVIQVFDPTAVNVGDHCDLNNIQNAASKVNPHTNASDAAVRYKWGDASNNPGAGAFCSGDFNDEDPGHPPNTTYLIRQDLNPYSENTNPVVPVGTCAGEQFAGFTGDVAAALDASSASYRDDVASVFRQWIPICNFIPDQYPANDYLLQIRTNIAYPAPSQAAMAGTGDPTINTGGSNRFSIRAAWVNGSTIDNTGIQVFGNQLMGLYANASAGQPAPNFYMARVLPAAAGQTLRVKLWDIGDCGGGCGQNSVILTFTLPNNQTATCAVSIHFPSSQTNVGNSCSFATWTSNYNGDNDWLVIDINLPSTYTCTVSDPFDCWVRMKYSTSNGALNDTTTWSAQLLGNPVRLIK